MQPLVLVTRPIEQATEFAEQLESVGFASLIQPLLTIENVPAHLMDAQKPVAIILSSRQALRYPDIPLGWNSIPIFCVGSGTEQTARNAGFQNVVAGQGDLPDILPLIRNNIPTGQRILYLRGEDVRHDLNKLLPEYDIQEFITYYAEPVSKLHPDVLKHFGEIGVITLFSVRSGAVLKRLIHENGLISHVKNINLLCLSHSVVESMVEMGWRSCVSSDRPSQSSIIEKLKSL